MLDRDSIVNYCNVNQQRFLDELCQFVRFKTVGNNPRFKSAVNGCVAWLERIFWRTGFTDVTVIETWGNPVIIASYITNAAYPTIVFYGHYDIAAISDDLSDFSPFVKYSQRPPYLYGRGSSDDKGQIWAHIKAIEYFLHGKQNLNINIKVILEGNEETGSKPLLYLLKQAPSLVSADAVIVSDMPMADYNMPSIIYSLRGSFSFKLTIQRHQTEMHSGNYGGILIDPAFILCDILHSLYSYTSNYGLFHQIDATEREFMHRNGFDNVSMRSRFSETLPEEALHGRTLYENSTIMPSVTVTGLYAGNCEHEQNAIVSSASAIINIRFPFTTDGQFWYRTINKLLKRKVPSSLHYYIDILSLSNGVEIDRNDSVIAITHSILSDVYGTPPRYVRLGGTIPVVETFYNKLSIPVLMSGSGLPDDAIHSRSERYHIPTFLKSIMTSILLIHTCSLNERSIS
jgi:acetylornithine deacetylase/succinyl-diaminopimelate desuccinylase-like protein